MGHTKIPNNQVQKLDDWSKKVVNLGKEPVTKGYRLYDPERNRIYVSRDATFDDTRLWPWNQSVQGENLTENFSILMYMD